MSKLLTAIGLMSGTSLDGIDVALVQSDGHDVVNRGPSLTVAYEAAHRDVLRKALSEAKVLTDRNDRSGVIGDAENLLTELHIDAVQSFVLQHSLSLSNIDLIGFHGQTVIHRPEVQLTVQIGNGQRLADALGIPVVHDMRAADVAAGGQGAPLVPIYHKALSAAAGQGPVVFVNIGGVSNVTYIHEEILLAFDAGPGNALIDDWMLAHFGRTRDDGGRVALSGAVNDEIVASCLSYPFFALPVPKSIDREHFSRLDLKMLSAADGAATLAAITAHAIAATEKHFPAHPRKWIVSGGGRHNAAIMNRLGLLLGTVKSAEDCGFDGDAMEAEAWAYLAIRSLKRLPLSFPTTTGVHAPITGGIIATPSNAAHGRR